MRETLIVTLKMEIVSHETIKPCTSTPPSLRNYKLSHMDQLCPYQYVPYLLFYHNAATDDQWLKKALAETLTRMFPLAGRANDDDLSVDCNDRGADCTVTRINESISSVLETPKTECLRQLLPLNLSPTWRSSTSSQLLVAIQINHFSCGGVVIGACIRHNMADASAASAFLQMWAAITCGNRKYVPEVDYGNLIFSERTTLFPPREDLDSCWKEDHPRVSQVNKLVVFDSSKVDALREKVGYTEKATRVQAVMAFLWAAMISSARDRNQDLEMHVMTTPVNLRNKMDPPLPAYSLGNIYHLASAIWKAAADDQTKIEYSELVRKMKSSINRVTEDLARKVHCDPEFINNCMAGIKLLATCSKLEAYVTSSWCGFPFYELDFGWGKPVWVATLAPANNMGILLDTSDGAGVQAWLSLRKQDMAKLEKDPNFLAYVSAIHTL